MKLLSLNIWGGQVYKPLLSFIEKQAKDTDIFCFQEVMESPVSKFSNRARTDIYKDLKKILNKYNAFLATPILSQFDLEEKVEFDLTFGQATFIKKNLKVISEKTTFVYKNNGPVSMWDIKRSTKKYLDIPRNIQCLTIQLGKKKLLIGNLHGFWMPISKKDSPHRIRQSRKVREILDSFSGPKILCGDFNLRPDTKSMKILEETMSNLIVKYGVTSTRSGFHKRGEKFADYVMTSPDIKVIDFNVLENSVSDHSPLVLKFEV